MDTLFKYDIFLINNLSQHLVDSKLEKDYSFYFQLNSLSENHQIKSYTSKIDDMVQCTGLSKRCFYDRLKALKQKGWVDIEKKDLRLLEASKLILKINGSYQEDLIRKIKVDSLKKGVTAIRYDVLRNHFLTQVDKIEEKISKYHKKVTDGTIKNDLPSFFVNFNKIQNGLTRFKIQEIARINELRKKEEKVKDLIDFNLSASRSFIAKLLKFKSKSSAHNFIQEIKSYGWVKEEVKYGVIAKTSKHTFEKLKNNNPGSGITFSKGCVIKKMTSIFKPLNDESFPDYSFYEYKYKEEREYIDKVYNNLIATQQFLYNKPFNTIDQLMYSIDKTYERPHLRFDYD